MISTAGGCEKYFSGCSKRPPGEAAGSPATEAYAFRYVAGRRATENKAGGLFHHPLLGGEQRSQNMVAPVHVDNFAGDAAAQRAEQEQGGVAALRVFRRMAQGR